MTRRPYIPPIDFDAADRAYLESQRGGDSKRKRKKLADPAAVAKKFEADKPVTAEKEEQKNGSR